MPLGAGIQDCGVNNQLLNYLLNYNCINSTKIAKLLRQWIPRVGSGSRLEVGKQKKHPPGRRQDGWMQRKGQRSSMRPESVSKVSSQGPFTDLDSPWNDETLCRVRVVNYMCV